jgi:hypothetical protein
VQRIFETSSSRFYGNLPKTLIDLNRSMSARAGMHQLTSINGRRWLEVQRLVLLSNFSELDRTRPPDREVETPLEPPAQGCSG